MKVIDGLAEEDIFRGRFLRLFFILVLQIVFVGGEAGAEESVDRELKILRAQVQRIMQRIDHLEKQRARDREKKPVATAIPPASHRTGPGVAAGGADDKRLQGKIGETTFTFGGRVRLEAMFSDPSVGGAGGENFGDYFFYAAGIPTGDDAGEAGGQVTFSARQSRFKINTDTPTAAGPLKGLLEFDLFGSSGNERVSNAHNPRLRHAYGQFAGFTFGQTHSTFMHEVAWPAARMDPVGIVYARQPLLRYTWELADEDDFQFSLEQPETTLTDSSGDTVLPGDDRFPDLAMKYTWRGKGHAIALAGLLRNIRADGVAGGREDSRWGGALHLAGKVDLLEKDDLRLGIAHGRPLGRYAAYNVFNDGALDVDGGIHLYDTSAAYFSWRHWWNDSWRSVFAWGGARADHDLTLVAATVPRWSQSYHANLGFSPAERLYLGLESVHGIKRLENGVKGELDRLLLVTNYDF